MDLNLIPRELETQDFHLRPSAITDVEAMFTMLSDPESMKYWSDPPISSMEEAVKVLMEDLDSDAKGNSMCWAVTRNKQYD